MKPRLIFLGMLFSTMMALAQDVIVKTDGTKLEVKVEEITETDVRYRKATKTTGPIYSISVNSIASIVFEDGSVETFSTPSVTRNTFGANQSQGEVTDAMLLRMSRMNEGVQDVTKLYSKAKTYRIVGWVGGGVFLAAGIATGWDLAYQWDADEWAYIFSGIGAAAATGWCLGFNLKANSLMRQARQIEMYSANIIEDEILHFGKNTLIAGISALGNRATHTPSLAVSLKLNF